MIFGNNKCNRNTCIGSIYRFFANKLPNWFIAKYRKMFNITDPVEEDDSCVGKNGPCRYFILVSFAILYGGLVLDFWIFTYPYLHYIYKNMKVHTLIAILIAAFPWVIVIALQYMDPGVITSKNVINYLKKYPYDFVIYNHKTCRTLKIPVVPRSRYCNYTKRRVARYDHYCPWVMASIGERNHRYFLLFLIGCIAASVYYMYGDIMVTALVMYTATKKVKWTTSPGTNVLIFMVILLKVEKWNAFCILLFLLIIIFLLFFVLQQIYYISIGKTQVELDKWDELYHRMKDNKEKKEIQNAYNHGIIQNWKEFLFPASVPDGPEWKPDKYWRKILDRDRKEYEEHLKAKQKCEHEHAN